MQGVNAVVTTGIYCRPPCGGRPLPRIVREFGSAAAAEAAGYRACHRCRPYRSDPPLPWSGSEIVCRAVQLVLDGALDVAGEAELGARLGISARHLRREFLAHVGVTPDQLARSRRAHFARRLLDDTDLTNAQIAFAAGYGSVRQYNRAMLDVFRATPTELRARRRVSDRLAADGGLVLRLPFRPPLAWTTMLGFLERRAIPGVEAVSPEGYRRTVVIDGHPGVLELLPGEREHLLLRAHLPRWEGLIHHVRRARRIFNLDADVGGATRRLRADPALGEAVRDVPGLRPVGTWDPFETGVRSVIGQQITVAGATTITGRLVERYGTPVPGLAPLGLTHTFPSPEVVAVADLRDLGLTAGRAAAVSSFARAVADGSVPLDRSRSLDAFVGAVTAVPGLGPWTAHYLALRMGEPDAFPPGDRSLERAMAALTARGAVVDPGGWRPWRAFAAAHLWSSAGAGPSVAGGRQELAGMAPVDVADERRVDVVAEELLQAG
jgi:AraC family transcriptional regulator of adaptative response / DNA-3-methyladenine glycosylase II